MTLFDTYRVTSHLLDLENNWAVWCEYLEGQQELDMLMATDRDRLYALLLSLIHISEPTRRS